MAWREMFTSHLGLVYRKRYQCPYCKAFMLKVEYDEYAICGQCKEKVINADQIEEIIDHGEFNGYFTGDEYRNSFEPISYEEKERMCEEREATLEGKRLNTRLSENQVKSLNISGEKTEMINELLDDLYILYHREYDIEEKPQELNDEQYVFNLIEDAHFFANQVSHDIVFYDYVIYRGIQEEKEFGRVPDASLFYSGRFFISNAIHHQIDAWERIVNILAIMYGVPYNKEPKMNSADRLGKELNGTEEYKKNKKLFEKVNALKGSEEFRKISKARQELDHDISPFLKMMREVGKEKGPDYLFDKEMKKEYIGALVKNTERLVNIIIEVIEVYKKKVIDEKEEIKVPDMFKTTYAINYSTIEEEISTVKPITPTEVIKINEESKKQIDKLKKILGRYRDEEVRDRLTDIIFRQHEVHRCVNDILNCLSEKGREGIRRLYPLPITIDKQYFVYAALYRVYSNYDKLGKLICLINNLGGDNEKIYFEDAVKYCNADEKVRLKYICNNMVYARESKEYNYLYHYRNMLTHIIRIGALQGAEGCEVCEDYITYLLVRNSNYINRLINELLKG